MPFTNEERVAWFLSVAIPSIIKTDPVEASDIFLLVESGDLASAEDVWEESFTMPLYDGM